MKRTSGNKRILAMILALVMCIGLLPMSALAVRITDDEIAIDAPAEETDATLSEQPEKPLDAAALTADTAPALQKQEDFTYTETFANQDDTTHRMRANINLNWQFSLGDIEGAEAMDFDDSAWRTLNLPHDWTIEGEYSESNPSGGSCGYLPGGVGWYRKTLTIPAAWRDGRQVSIEFDGVFRNSKVYLDGELLGERPYGWISFAYDITDKVQGKEQVEIAVRVDNSLEPAARWYTGSGIYGNVYILSTEDVHIDRYGTYVTTPTIEATSAVVKAETTVKNSADAAAQVTLRSTIYPKNGDGAVATATAAEAVEIAAGETAAVTQELTVQNPLLWDTENPNLYRIRTEVLVDGTVVDDQDTTFGIRSISFSASEGFFLNGVQTKLKGVADHWAAGALGAALTENIVRERLQMLKDMGVNAVRTSHNPRPAFFYDLCDEMGILVMDEIFDGWKQKATHDYGRYSFAEWWQTDTTEWVKRDRNHPSVILWSIGNETGTNDTNGIATLIKSLDDTRATTGGGVSGGVDVVGINGPSENKNYTQPNTSKPFVATEAPHTWQVRGMYKTQTWYRDNYNATTVVEMPNLTETEIFRYDWMESPTRKRGFQSSYDNAYVRTPARSNWARTRDMDWRMGEFRWTGFDYLGEASYVSGGWPYRLFTSGAIDCAMFEKDLYYLYQSMWTEEPMIHILPSWTHPIMEEGTEIPVWVYSNCEAVELFQDGVSLGKVTRGPMDERVWDEIQYEWMVPWKAGTITAVGYDSAGNEQTRQEYKTAGAPAKLTLESTSEGNLPVDHTYIDQITVTATDAEGNFYPYGENRVYYHIDGPAYLKAVDNGSPVDVEQHYGVNNRNFFMGLNKVFLCPTQDEGDVLFTAASIMGEKRQLTSNMVSIDVEQLALRGNPAKPAIQVYYTTDGSQPTQASTLYMEAFEVKLGKTVKAAVYADGQKILDLAETFSKDEGLFWDESTGEEVADEVPDSRACVYPASEATIEGNKIGLITTGSGYHENYIDFGNAPGTIRFTVTVPSNGTYYVGVRYNNGAPEATVTKKMSLTVNDGAATEYIYKNTGAWNNSWAYATHTVELIEGENTLTLEGTAAGKNGVNVDEIAVWPKGMWATPAEEQYTPTLGGANAVVKDDGKGALGVQYVDFGGSNGSVTYTLPSVEESGRYPLYLYYTSSKPVTTEKNLEIYVDDVKQSEMPIRTINTGSAFNSVWAIDGVWVTLQPKAAGHKITVKAPNGGAVLSGIMLGEEPVLPPLTGTVQLLNASCVADIRLGAGEEKHAVSAASTDLLDDSVLWYVSDAGNGVHIRNGKTGQYLSYNGTFLSLSNMDEDKNAQWAINGDREFFDYIQHVNTGKKLGVQQDGSLTMYDGDYGVDDDFVTNLAYWTVKGQAGVSEAAPATVAAGITQMTAPENGQETLTLPTVDEAYVLSIVSSSHPNIIGLDGTITYPAEDTAVTLTLRVQRSSDFTTAKTAPLTVTIPAAVPVTGVTLDKTSVSLTVDGTTTLTATILPANATNQSLTWTSSDETVATVDSAGVVTAVAVGTATITVTTEDGGKTATCVVTVTNPAKPSRPSTGGGSSTPSETTKTETREDGSKVTTVTKPDGSKTVTVEQPDGTKSETITTKDGGVTITVTDPEGETIAKVELPATISEPETRFEDVPENHWADEAIHNAAALKLVEGVGDNKYDMVSPMTRGSLATVLHRLSQGKTDYENTFKDVAQGKYYSEGVAWAAKAGVVKGMTEELFAPEQVITREQLAVMLARYAKLIGMDIKADVKALEAFTDGENTGSWAIDGVAWCVENGILKGKGQNNLDPTENVTRAEVAVMLDRFIALIK